jgi:hypothetical protein
MLAKNGLLGIAATSALVASMGTTAGPLIVGQTVQIENRAGTNFTPAPGDGLFGRVEYQLDRGGTVDTNAGVFVLDYLQPGGSWEQFLAFCLEPQLPLTPFSTATVTTVGGAGYNAALFSELWGRYRGAVVDDRSAAAFQVALWELAYDRDDPARSLSAGNFALTGSSGGVRELAQSWLVSLDGSGPRAEGLVVLVDSLSNGDQQNLLTQVPEPATLGLLALGLAGAAVSRRRRVA